MMAPSTASALAWLKKNSTQRDRDNLKRFGITARNALGVSMTSMKVLVKQLGHNHELAAALWDTDCYEARMLATMIDDPAQVTTAQMDRWCADFDNWAICDNACFHLFDRTPHAFKKVRAWSKLSDEFGKRAAFALMASLALHDKKCDDDKFVECLPLIEKSSDDERNFVKKGVSWALRSIGHRNATLHAAAIALAERFIDSRAPATRWIGRDVLRDLRRPLVTQRVKAKASR